MAKRYHASERKEERKDSGMLSEDHLAPANMPQDVKYHAWPKAGSYADYDINDSISGVNRQMDEDGAGMKRHKGGNKW